MLWNEWAHDAPRAYLASFVAGLADSGIDETLVDRFLDIDYMGRFRAFISVTGLDWKQPVRFVYDMSCGVMYPVVDECLLVGKMMDDEASSPARSFRDAVLAGSRIAERSDE